MELKYRGAPVIYKIIDDRIIGICKIRKKEYPIDAKSKDELLEKIITIVDRAL